VEANEGDSLGPISRHEQYIHHQESLPMAASAGTVTGGERPCSFDVAPIQLMYMYKRTQEINKEYANSLSYNRIACQSFHSQHGIKHLDHTECS
jgi:hypothetical protein